MSILFDAKHIVPSFCGSVKDGRDVFVPCLGEFALSHSQIQFPVLRFFVVSTVKRENSVGWRTIYVDDYIVFTSHFSLILTLIRGKIDSRSFYLVTKEAKGCFVLQTILISSIIGCVV